LRCAARAWTEAHFDARKNADRLWRRLEAIHTAQFLDPETPEDETAPPRRKRRRRKRSNGPATPEPTAVTHRLPTQQSPSTSASDPL
jgi:hypothetical protein